jgi:hypothetical protein
VGSQHFGPQLEVRFWWRPTGYNYPAPISEDFKIHYGTAFVYRWAIYRTASTDAELLEQYIGETAILSERLKDYLTGAGVSTDRRVKEVLDDRLSGGARIELQTLEFNPFDIPTRASSVPISTFEMPDEFKRKMMENLAILVFEKDCRLLNRRTDSISKKIRRGEDTRELLATPEGRKGLCEDRDVKTVLDIMKRREQMDRNAQTH